MSKTELSLVLIPILESIKGMLGRLVADDELTVTVIDVFVLSNDKEMGVIVPEVNTLGVAVVPEDNET